MIRNYFLFVLRFLFFMLLFSSCEHRPLVEQVRGVHYIRVYLDEEIKNVTCNFYNENFEKPAYKRPVVLRAVLADPMTGRVVSERFLQGTGEDGKGYYIDGYLNADPGEYHLMVYNYGTETTLIRHTDNFFQMEGYTYQIPDYLKSNNMRVKDEGRNDTRAVHYEPDLLFLVTRENIKIKETLLVDTLRTAAGEHFTAQSCIKSYYLQIRIKGVEYISSAVSTLTGMGANMNLSTKVLGGDAETGVYIPMLKPKVTTKQEGTESSVIYATFNTFGKLPDVSSFLQVNFDIVTVDGRSVSESMDITSLFDTEQVRMNQWILIEKEIVIDPPPTPEGGGFEPGVGDWEQEDSEIKI